MTGGILKYLCKTGRLRRISLFFILVFLLSCLFCPNVHAVEISLSFGNESGAVSDAGSSDDDDLFGPGGLFEIEELNSENLDVELFILFLILLAYVVGIGSFIVFYFIESKKSADYSLELSKRSRFVLFSFYLLAALICFVLSLALTIMGFIIGINSINYSSFFLEIFVFLFIFMLYLYLAYTVLRKRAAVFSVFVAPLTLLLIRIEMSIFYPYFSEFNTIDDSAFFIVVTVITFIVAVFHHSGNEKTAPVSPSPVTQNYNADPSRTETESTAYQFSNSGMLDDSGFPVALRRNYSETSIVGTGGTARVFKAKRIDAGKVVALKVPLFFDDMTGKAFLREMRIWKSLSHKNIVNVFSVNILPVPFVEMEYIESCLDELKKPLNVDSAIQSFKGVADGLSYVHSLGFAHRDIKPKNILVKDGETAKITDWGLGKIINDGTETTVSGFSLNYAAPEQISPKMYGKSGVTTDIYQMGILLYEMLTGMVPFSGGQTGIGDQSLSILNDDPVPPSKLDPKLKPFDAIIEKCMRKRPEERYSSVVEIIDDLRRLGFYKE